MASSKKSSFIYPESKEYKTIREWRSDERPRERLIQHGPDVLSDAELLTILIGQGTRHFSALDIARALLEKHESLTKLATCDFSEFKQIRGMGDAKAVTIAAAFEMSRRIKSEPFNQKKIFNSPDDLANYYIPRLRDDRTEKFRVLLLNSANQVLRELVISEGSINSSIVHAREVFRIAIAESAAAVILLHNHPSGNSKPSEEDKKVTKDLVEAGNTIGIKVIDHIIIAGDSYTSLANMKLI